MLGVARGAPSSEVSRAYRRRARATHPDQGGSAHEFQQVHQAWELIRSATSADAPSAVDEDSAWSWLPAMPARGWGPVEVRPGRHFWASRAGLIVATVVWALCGVALVAPSPDPSGLLGFAWAGSGWWWSGAWLVAVVITGVRGIAGDYSAALVVCGVLLVVAAFGHIGTLWWWACLAWAVLGFVGPMVRIMLDRPMWTIGESLEDGPVFGDVSAADRPSADLVEQLCQIPAVRVFHEVPGALHVVVCGTQVAAFGVEDGWEFPGVSIARTWSVRELLRDPGNVLDEVTGWLTAGGGGVVVDRRVLADLGC